MTAERFDLVIRGGVCVTPSGRQEMDLGIRHGRLVHFGSIAPQQGREVLDATGLLVLPGVIDSQVHFREPGLEHKEDLETGTRAAVLGGVTALFEMPNTSPSTTTAEALGEKLSRAKDRAWCDYAFYVGASPENIDQLPILEMLPGCCGIKIFMGSSTGSLLVAEDACLRQVLASGRRRVAVHCEDEMRLAERRSLIDAAMAQGDITAALHPVWRDAQTALRATTRLLRLARQVGRAVHVLHVTTGDEMALLAEHRDIASVEVTPQHLTLTAPDCYERLGSLAQMNPPIRSAEHQDALWAALRDGVVDVLGSDHAPHTLKEKQQPYPKSPSGMPGVQTLLPLMLDHVHAGRLTLERLVDLTSAGPARLFGLAGKGRIALGYEADLTLVDPARKMTIAHDWLASRCGWSPFEGRQVTGWPMATVIRGRVVMRDGALLGPPAGAPIRFHHTLQGEG